MRKSNKHFRQVEAWATLNLAHLPREKLIIEFDLAFGRIWEKAILTLGKVTLQAVLERVIYVSVEKHSWLTPNLNHLEYIRLAGLVEKKSGQSDDEIRSGLIFLLGEFLSVIGSLTADIITPKLHAALIEVSSSSKPLSETIQAQADLNSPVAKGGMK